MNRASHIDVDSHRARALGGIRELVCRLSHNLGLRAENLYGNRTFVGHNSCQGIGFLVSKAYGLCADHLADGMLHAVLMADKSHRSVGVACHGGEE